MLPAPMMPTLSGAELLPEAMVFTLPRRFRRQVVLGA
jgi:hypothetical protein